MTEYEFVVSLARAAGKRLKEAQASSFSVSHKGEDTRNVITTVDMDINTFISAAIKKAYPDHLIYSEENASNPDEVDAYTWMIDPLDGSANFSRHIPHFSVSIGLQHNNTPLVGAVYNPITDELFSMERGRGVFLNTTPVSIRPCAAVEEAQVLFTPGHNPLLRNWTLTVYEELLSRVKKIKNFGSSALDLSFLAAGRADVVVYGTLTTNDCLAAIGMVREMGGEVYTLSGSPVLFTPEPQTIIATAHKELQRELSQYLHADLLSAR